MRVFTVSFCLLFIGCTLNGFVHQIAHDWRSKKARDAFEAGDINHAHELYLRSLEHASVGSQQQVQAQYNLSRTSFERNELDAAAAYAQTVAEAEHAPGALREQAYSNWGYALFRQKKLPEALEKYEKVIELSSEHEVAQHNIELIKKMMEQQEQQDNQQDNNSEQSEKDQEQDQSEQNDTGGGAGEQQQDQEERNESGDKDEQQSEQNQDMQDGQGSDQDPKDEQKDQQQREQHQHDTTPEQHEEKGSPQDKDESSSAQDERRNVSAVAAEQQWSKDFEDAPELVALLQEQEEQDEQTGKEMVKCAISQQMPHGDTTHCW